MPNIKNAYDQISKDSIVFIGIITDDKETVTKFLSKNELGWYQIMNLEEKELSDEDKKVKKPKFLEGLNKGINKDYEITTWPTTFLIDPNGKIIAKNLGGPNLTEAIMKLIEENEGEMNDESSELIKSNNN